jgi:hypothetical protein
MAKINGTPVRDLIEPSVWKKKSLILKKDSNRKGKQNQIVLK